MAEWMGFITGYNVTPKAVNGFHPDSVEGREIVKNMERRTVRERDDRKGRGLMGWLGWDKPSS